MSLFGWMYPDEYLDSTYEIDFKQLYEDGFRGVIFDIDNTLVEQGAPSDERSRALLASLKDMGYKVMLLSNNRKTRDQPIPEPLTEKRPKEDADKRKRHHAHQHQIGSRRPDTVRVQHPHAER